MLKKYVIVPILVATVSMMLMAASLVIISFLSEGTLPVVKDNQKLWPLVLFLWAAIAIGLALQKLANSRRDK